MAVIAGMGKANTYLGYLLPPLGQYRTVDLPKCLKTAAKSAIAVGVASALERCIRRLPNIRIKVAIA